MLQLSTDPALRGQLSARPVRGPQTHRLTDRVPWIAWPLVRRGSRGRRDNKVRNRHHGMAARRQRESDEAHRRFAHQVLDGIAGSRSDAGDSGRKTRLGSVLVPSPSHSSQGDENWLGSAGAQPGPARRRIPQPCGAESLMIGWSIWKWPQRDLQLCAPWRFVRRAVGRRVGDQKVERVRHAIARVPWWKSEHILSLPSTRELELSRFPALRTSNSSPRGTVESSA